jgi:hypothetical protein
VQKIIRDLTPQQVLDLGKELGLYHSTLKLMPQESIHGVMVHAWLMKMDDVPEVGGDRPNLAVVSPRSGRAEAMGNGGHHQAG